MTSRDRIEHISTRGLDARAMRAAMLDEIRLHVPFDFYAWLLTDPETTVGASPLAETPSLPEVAELIRLKYLTPTNRWTTLPSNVAATLIGATGGHRSTSRLWNELLNGYGVDDVMSIVFRDHYGCWGFLDLWRLDGSFSIVEVAVLDDLVSTIAAALRNCLAPTFESGSIAIDRNLGPAVLLLSDDLDVLSRTAQTEAFLRELLPTELDRSPVPAAAYNVAAQLLAVEAGVDTHPPWARVHLHDGIWVSLRAARIDSAPATAGTIAVSIELTPPSERTALYARVIGLSDRESEVLRRLVGGNDTRQLARALFVSEHTVQDHLKSIFAKAGVNNRRVLVAHATGLG